MPREFGLALHRVAADAHGLRADSGELLGDVTEMAGLGRAPRGEGTGVEKSTTGPLASRSVSVRAASCSSCSSKSSTTSPTSTATSSPDPSAVSPRIDGSATARP